MRKVVAACLCFAAACCTMAEGVTYYYNGTGVLSANTSWFTNRNGTGSNPTGFVTAGDTFIIQAGQNPTLTGSWTISGTGSGLLIESGGSMSTGANDPNLTLSLQSGASYFMNNTVYTSLKIGTLASDSTFNINKGATVLRLASITYGNLQLFGSNNLTLASSGITTTGDLSVINSGQVTLTNTDTPLTHSVGGDLLVGTGAPLALSQGTAVMTMNLGGGLSNHGTISKTGNGLTSLNFNGTGVSDASWGSNSGNFNVSVGANKSLNSSGAINNGTGTVTVSGTLNVTNIGSIAGTGGVTLNSGGTLLLGANEQIANSAPIRLAGGNVSTGGFSETVGALTLTANSVLDCGNASSFWIFASSTGQNWTGGQLQIWNWSGSTMGGGADRVFFGTSSSGLNTSQLERIVFYSDTGATPLGAATILPTGEIVPVPEASSAVGALALLGLVAYRERRRIIGRRR